jgi:hypothetical protein
MCGPPLLQSGCHRERRPTTSANTGRSIVRDGLARTGVVIRRTGRASRRSPRSSPPSRSSALRWPVSGQCGRSTSAPAAATPAADEDPEHPHARPPRRRFAVARSQLLPDGHAPPSSYAPVSVLTTRLTMRSPTAGARLLVAARFLDHLALASQLAAQSSSPPLRRRSGARLIGWLHHEAIIGLRSEDERRSWRVNAWEGYSRCKVNRVLPWTQWPEHDPESISY